MTTSTSDQEAACRRPTYFIDSDHPRIREKARLLTAGREDEREKARALFLFVRDEISYNPYCISPEREDCRAHVVLARKEGFCIQKAVLLAALCRAAAIPCRLAFADLRNHQVPPKLAALMQTNIFHSHGYNEILLGGRWLAATPTFDRHMCSRLGLRPVEFDGRRDAVFSRHSLDGRLHIEYLRKWGPYDDLPFAEIVKTFREKYGQDKFAQLRSMNANRQAAACPLIIA